VQVYLPSAGWIEFDPTNGIVGTRDLIRVAVARDPRQAIPLHGAYLGSADAFAGMEVSINVVSVGDELEDAEVLMQIKVGFEISYAAAQPTPMVTMLGIHPSRFSDIVGTESIVAEPNVPIGFYRDSFGNVCGRLVAPAGGVTFHGHAVVRDSGLPDLVVPTAQQVPIDQLPDELLLYLMPSRYCETDKLTDIAWSLFGTTQPGWARVQAIVDFVHNHVTFGYEHAHFMKSAHDVYEQGAGVCRDFRASGADLLPLHEHPGALLHRLSRRYRRAQGSGADGFLRLVPGLSVRPVVHLRRPPQSSAHRPHPDRAPAATPPTSR